jgi:hypothetical protein
MPFYAILLLLFGFETTTAPPLSHFLLPIPGANTIAGRVIPESEQSSNQENNSTKQSHATRKRAWQEAQTQTLTGIVEWEYKPLAWDCDVPNCDHFALYDDATRTNYELDDARAALPFEGKRARVTGVVNTKDSIIRVISIEGLK